MLAEILLSTPELFALVASSYPGGKLAAMPEPVDSRWHFVLQALAWILGETERRAKVQQAILLYYKAAQLTGKVNTAKLTADAEFALYHLSSPVTLAAMSVAFDVGAATVKPELQFLQSGNGLHMSQLHDFFQITGKRRLALRAAANGLAVGISQSQIDEVTEVIDQYRADELSPTDDFASIAPSPSRAACLTSCRPRTN